MGRKRKYFNEEEQKKANREKVLRFYYANKEDCDRKARERYWAKKLANGKNGTSGSDLHIETGELLTIPEQTDGSKQ